MAIWPNPSAITRRKIRTVPLISILSSVYGPSATYLDETIASVRNLALPGGWELEWVVQEDGAEPSLADRLKSLEIVNYQANNAQLGIAITRNLALSRVSGSLVQALDHDDILLPRALTTLIPHFDDRRVQWTIGQADDLLPDGTREVHKSAIPFGLTPAGAMNQWAAEHDGNWPIQCAALMMRTTTLRALGGWTGIPYDDDVSMFAALSEITDGYYEEELTWLFRHHPLQLHRTPVVISRSAEGRRIALARAHAARASGLMLDPAKQKDTDVSDISLGPAVKQRG
jgi:glycosyltransferase involved in cell wall biosynthesis